MTKKELLQRIATKDPRYAIHLPEAEAATITGRVACRHRGEPTGRLVPCGTCPGGVKLKVFACDIHGECTTERAAHGCGCCAHCTDYAPPVDAPEAGATRHLLYHLYPVKGDRWLWNLQQMARRQELFDGRKIIAVAVDHRTVNMGEVRQWAPWFDEYIEVPNNPELREVATFEPLFSRVAEFVGPGDVTLWAHGKGVTRERHPTSLRWAETMLEVNLDHWPKVQAALQCYPVAGAFQRTGKGWTESASTWHYSGSYFWFRNRDLFSKPDWNRIDPFIGGIESYPSLHFPQARAANLFHAFTVGGDGLYRESYWRDKVEPELALWRRENANLRGGATDYVVPPPGSGPLLNLGCGPHSFPGWVNVDVVESSVIKPDVLAHRGQKLPFHDGHFTAAYLGHVLEHHPWDRVPDLLRDVARVVRPGGRIVVVGPDLVKALEQYGRSPSQGRLQHVWEVAEDANHYQRESPEANWPEARHHWNCYLSRVVAVMRLAGLLDVQEVPFTQRSLAGWPVVDYSVTQCAATGVVAK